ncbi:DNA gyrase inhibitor YacG [Aurantiacibacter spongiae]|uniref:DNA gyrase inhibitor YacG n=1 Tax=Aurantiacibacter spongiae TaxID=2488860 RepID=A0A3N5CPF4_9SPHN|nr:DNA gyrase inhibitor YacG [Aurantiacibacter spongiae]RPF70873.1 DNA gyrase inhibitor YacG [Aurantiacibacter spongiae]
MTTTRKCPICRKPRAAEHAPFCSPRCRDRDLAQWFGDGYAVPGPAATPEDMMGEMQRREGDAD